jgi:hypothetical protein
MVFFHFLKLKNYPLILAYNHKKGDVAKKSLDEKAKK